MSEIELERKAEIEAIELTDNEIKFAIEEAKIKKWFQLKNKDYWSSQEKIKERIFENGDKLI